MLNKRRELFQSSCVRVGGARSLMKRVPITVGVGVLVVLVTTTFYPKRRLQNGWCVRYSPDGVQTLYGGDCKR